MNLVQKALEFAINAHKDQIRKGDGKPYILHPVGVALNLAQEGADNITIAAGLLHDVLEDTEVSREILEKEFGTEIAKIVNDVTEQDKSLPWKVRKTQAIEHITKMGKRSLLVKTADKINNLESMLSIYNKEGPVIFKRFNAPLSEQIKMDKRLYQALRKRWSDNSLLERFRVLKDDLEAIEISQQGD